MKNSEILQEIKDHKCSNVIFEGEIFSITKCSNGSAFLIKDMVSVKDINGKSVKISKSQVEEGLIAYWQEHNGSFIEAAAAKIVAKNKSKELSLEGILKYHATNIQSTLAPYLDSKAQADSMMFSGQNESEDIDYLLEKSTNLFTSAMEYVYNNSKAKELRTYDGFFKYMTEELLDPYYIIKCYYGNVICDFVDDKTIIYKGRTIVLKDDMYRIGAFAFRMQSEMNLIKSGMHTNGLFNGEMKFESFPIADLMPKI